MVAVDAPAQLGNLPRSELVARARISPLDAVDLGRPDFGEEVHGRLAQTVEFVIGGAQ